MQPRAFSESGSHAGVAPRLLQFGGMSQPTNDPPCICSCRSHCESRRSTVASATAGSRLLFVDDDATVLAGYSVLFRRVGWDMVFAQSADEALAELHRAPVDAVVSDLCMPGMDGATLLARVKVEWPGTLRIMVSASACIDDLTPGIVDAFLEKPCEAAALRATLERLSGSVSSRGAESVSTVGRPPALEGDERERPV